MAERALATAFVSIVPSMQGFQSTLQSQLSGEAAVASEAAGAVASNSFGSGFGAKLKGSLIPALGTLGVAFGAIGVVNFTKDLYNSAVEGEKTDKVLTNITNSMGLFGDSAGSVVTRLQDFATTQMRLTGIDDDVIKSAQSKLMTFSAVGKTADEMGGAFDRATVLAADLSAAGFGSMDSASVMLGKALQDPVKGVTALQRVGVSLSEAQKKQVEDFVKVNDVAGAQKIILDEVARQVGGTAEASATAGEKMAARWDDAVQALGTSLMPVFDGMISFLSDTVVPAFETSAGSIQGLFGWFGDNQGWLIPLFSGLGAAVLALGTYTAAMGIAAAVTAAGGLPAIIAATWAWTAALLANPVTWVILGIGLLVAAIVGLATHWDEVTKFVNNVWNGFVGWLQDSLKNISMWWTNTWNGVVNFLRDAWNNIKTGVSNGIDAVLTWFKELPGRILAGLGNLGNLLLSVGHDIIEGLWNGLKARWDGVMSWVSNAAANISGTFKKILGIQSPSKVFHGFGENIGQGLVNGLDSMTGLIYATMDDIGTKINGQMQTISQTVSGEYFNLTAMVNKRNTELQNLIGAGYTYKAAQAQVDLVNGGSLQSVLDIAEGGATFTNTKTNMQTTFGGNVAGIDPQVFQDLINQGYKQTSGNVVNYYAAPNNSINSDIALMNAIKRSRILD